MSSIYQQATYLKSVHNLKDLPPDDGIEVAFVGRSNVGKSSVLNTLTRQRGLAHVSKTPGRTQQINFFTLTENHYLVDLPGYGYAKVPASIRKHWEKALAQYLETRASLRGIVLIMDIRHPMTEFDISMLEFCHYHQLDMVILLNKVDKLKKGPAQNTVLKVRKYMQDQELPYDVIPYSALKRTGIEVLEAKLDDWYQFTDET